MAIDLLVFLEDKPGTLAILGESLGKAGVNIGGVCGFPCKGRGEIHILVDDAGRARKALKSAGLKIEEEREVLVFGVEDKPGRLGEIARDIAKAGVNINLIYLNMKGELVLGADDLDRARSAVEAASGKMELM